jgi:hypothetical protein
MSNKSIILNTNRPGFFTPQVNRSSQDSMLAAAELKERTFKSFENTNLKSSSSFRYGNKVGLVSTQQLSTDYSKFENHTFFHSAVAKTNESFDKIINYYPFDGSNKNIEKYEDSLTGFEKHILDSFPKNVGYLVFSGTQKGEVSGGTYISINDTAGSEYIDLASLKTGKTLLNPNQDPFSFEFHIMVPEKENDNQVILQKIEKDSIAKGMTLALSYSLDTSKCNLLFGITSGSSNLYATTELNKGRFYHILAGYDKVGNQKLHIVKNCDIENKVTSSLACEFDNLSFANTNFLIGSGSSVRLNGAVNLFKPQQTFSGSLDEFRYYRSLISLADSKKYKHINLDFNNADKKKKLILYYKFNEPYGTHSGNNLILDSSGNSFNTEIINFTVKNRLTSSLDLPLKQENIKRSPVLFPDFPRITTLNNELMVTASLYDDFNPNLITKLVPSHYFEEGNVQEDFNEVLGTFANLNLTGGASPGTSQIKSSQQLTIFLLVWAKFFDELKLFVDAFSNLKNLSYETFDTIPDALLLKAGEMQGIKLPALFRGSNINQLLTGIDLNENPVKAQKPLIEIQNIVWKRILASLPYINLTRGTLNSVESIFRSAGIDPNNLFLIREYGGSSERKIDNVREHKKDVIKLVSFSGSISSNSQNLDYQGRPDGKPNLKSGYLNGSRLSPGLPALSGTPSDGLFTTSSFTVEGQYKFNDKSKHPISQSLMRMHITGTQLSSRYESAVTNLIYNDTSKKLSLFFIDSPNPGNSTPFINNTLTINDIDMFDADLWNVSFGFESGDKTGNINSGSVFLRAGKAFGGQIEKVYHTSSFYNRVLDSGSPTSVFSNITELNTSGTFLLIGSQSLGGGSDNSFINSNAIDPFYKTTDFTGELGSVRMWSKKTSLNEWKTHLRNPLNFGTNNPASSYLFEKNISGSFEKLRFLTYTKQNTTGSDNIGKFRFFDFSHNNNHFEGSGFESNKNIVKSEHIIFNTLSPYFDLSIADKKVRVRSLSDNSRIEENPYALTTPIHEVFPGEKTLDDPRFAIELSTMKGLNDDIIRIFSDYDYLEKALGKTNILFSDRYPSLMQLRKLYFENVLEELDLGRYRELFKWIDNSFTDLIGGVLPHTTKFMGINFIYENHMLERNRFRYLFDEIYLKSKPIVTDRSLSLSQFVAIIKRM